MLSDINTVIATIIKQIIQSVSPSTLVFSSTALPLAEQVNNSITSSAQVIGTLLQQNSLSNAITTALSSSANITFISNIFLTFTQNIYQLLPTNNTIFTVLTAINLAANIL